MKRTLLLTLALVVIPGAETGAQQIEMRVDVETLGVILPVVMILAIVLIVLGLLWFVYRIATATFQTRDYLMEVNKHLDLANQHLAGMAANTHGGRIPSESSTLTSDEE